MTRTMTARRESECSPCGQTILAGDTISKAGRRWVCGPCAALHADAHPRSAMTAEKAGQFDHYSEANAESVQEQSIDAGCDGTCEAYVSIFTLARWEGKGMEPRADEPPAIATSWRSKKDDDGNVIARWKKSYEVWCRHQVEPLGAPELEAGPVGLSVGELQLGEPVPAAAVAAVEASELYTVGERGQLALSTPEAADDLPTDEAGWESRYDDEHQISQTPARPRRKTPQIPALPGMAPLGIRSEGA